MFDPHCFKKVSFMRKPGPGLNTGADPHEQTPVNEIHPIIYRQEHVNCNRKKISSEYRS